MPEGDPRRGTEVAGRTKQRGERPSRSRLRELVVCRAMRSVVYCTSSVEHGDFRLPPGQMYQGYCIGD